MGFNHDLDWDDGDVEALGRETDRQRRRDRVDENWVKPRKEVMIFARAMEMQLRKHDDRGKDGWKDACAEDFARATVEHVEKLFTRLERRDPDQTRRDAADVGNFAMMVADCAGGLDLGLIIPEDDRRNLLARAEVAEREVARLAGICTAAQAVADLVAEAAPLQWAATGDEAAAHAFEAHVFPEWKALVTALDAEPPGAPTRPGQERRMCFFRGFGDGAKSSAIKLPEDPDYLAGYGQGRILATAAARAYIEDHDLPPPSILRTQEEGP